MASRFGFCKLVLAIPVSSSCSYKSTLTNTITTSKLNSKSKKLTNQEKDIFASNKVNVFTLIEFIQALNIIK